MRKTKTRVVGVKIKKRGKTTVITKTVIKKKRRKRSGKIMNIFGLKIKND